MTTFVFNDHKYDLKITYGLATRSLVEFDVHLTSLFEGENMENLLMRMFLNDDLALKLWWSYVKDYNSNYNDAVDLLTPEIVQDFKDKWWTAVASFFDPLRRDLLRSTLAEAPKLIRKRMKDAMKDSQENQSDAMS